ncbi:Cuticle protein 3 [Eumeta japonica]|uniref:Cuticle protein 3 n=1 Tax=Eumeta variegata TaxID=151549 RepID=A0A4C1WI84_EUMVA|nr:Cuticle protein 3 [Eumeta japonica]
MQIGTESQGGIGIENDTNCHRESGRDQIRERYKLSPRVRAGSESRTIQTVTESQGGIGIENDTNCHRESGSGSESRKGLYFTKSLTFTDDFARALVERILYLFRLTTTTIKIDSSSTLGRDRNREQDRDQDRELNRCRSSGQVTRRHQLRILTTHELTNEIILLRISKKTIGPGTYHCTSDDDGYQPMRAMSCRTRVELIITALIAACGAAKLDRTYLPPVSAATAGGSSGDIQLPFERSGSQTSGIEGIPKGGTINEFQGVVVDAAAPGTRSSDQETGLGGPRQSYGSQDSKVGEAAFKTSNANAQTSLNLHFNNGSPNSFQHSQLNGQNRPTDVQASGTQLSGQFGETVGQPFERIQAARDRVANTVKFESEVGPESFSYSFETDNGIAAEESGVASNGVQAKGGFSYTGDDGQVYSVSYTADEGGYQPVGDHLPTPPPIPEEILKSLEQNARDEAAGLIDDGSYDAQKYNEGGDYSESDGDSGQYNRNQARPGTGNFGQSGFANVDQSGRLTAANGNFGNTNKQAGQNFESNFNPNSFDNKSGSQASNVAAHTQHTTGFGNRLSSHTSAFATSFASNQGTDDQITRNSQNTPVAQLVGSAQNQQLQSSEVNLDKVQAGKDSLGAGTIQEIQTAKGTFGGSSRNEFGGITQAAYLPPTNQGTGKGSSRLQASSHQSVLQGPGHQHTFSQFHTNSQQQGYSTHPFSQQNNIGNKKSPNTQQPSNLQGRTEIVNAFNSAKNNVRDNFQSQGINNQPPVIQTTGPSNSPLSQTGIATSSIGNVSGQTETPKYGQSTSFNNRNSGTSPFISSQRQTQNQNRFNSQQFPTNPQLSSLGQQSSNVFQQQTSSLNIKSDQPYNYDRPSIPFQTDSGHPQQLGGSNRFPGPSSNQFNRLNQQYTDVTQTVAPDRNFNQKFPSSLLNSQSQVNAQSQETFDQPSSLASNQQTLSSSSNTFRGYQSNVPKQNTANFNQRGSSQASSQVSFPSSFPSIGTSAQLNVQNQQSPLAQNGYGKQTPNNIQNAGSQNGFSTSTQQINQFARPENNIPFNVGSNQQQETQRQTGEIYQYDKPAESLPMPNRDQSESSTQSGVQSSRLKANSQIFRPQTQFSSENVAGRGEIFDSSRKPPSFDSETGYHYR